MTKELYITVENKLVNEKRDIHVYHHSTRSAHIISYDNSIPLPLKFIEEDDYLHISIVSGPGPLKGDYRINLPSWIDFEFSLEGKLTFTHSHSNHGTLLKLFPGPPSWEINITRSANSNPFIGQTPAHFTISDT